MKNIKIAVLGGGGRTGQYLVRQLIEKGYCLKILLRNTETFQIKSPLLQIIQGDALDFTTVSHLLQECQAVISTIGQRPGEPLIAEQATANILKAMACYHIKRYILLAGINIDTPSDNKGTETMAATNWMKSNYPLIQQDRQKSYALLAGSDMHWTMVRVPLIIFSAVPDAMEVNLTDCPGNKINAGNIAAFLVKQLPEQTYFYKAPFIYNC